MSDSKSSYGEPVEEPRTVDDVVVSANEGIADAEAARRDAVVSDAHSTSAASGAASEPAADRARTTYSEPMVDEDPAFDSALYEAHAEDATPARDVSTPAAAPTYAETSSTQTVTPSEPVSETPVAPAAAAAGAGAAAAGAGAVTTAYAPQPIFVQAPEAPRPRGNRAAAGAIGLLAALAFGVLYLAVWLGVGLIDGDVTLENLGQSALAALGTWSLWVPIVVFYIAFWLLGAIINRGRWGAWVIFGLLVGVAAYLGHLLGALFQAPFWMLTASEGTALVEAELLTPLAIGAFIIGRELTIWFGAWVAARGARVTELNVEAQREYERTLEAGPQLTRV